MAALELSSMRPGVYSTVTFVGGNPIIQPNERYPLIIGEGDDVLHISNFAMERFGVTYVFEKDLSYQVTGTNSSFSLNSAYPITSKSGVSAKPTDIEVKVNGLSAPVRSLDPDTGDFTLQSFPPPEAQLTVSYYYDIRDQYSENEDLSSQVTGLTSKFIVKHLYIVDGTDRGAITYSPESLEVTLGGVPVNVIEVNGRDGEITLQDIPVLNEDGSTPDLRVSYYHAFPRMYDLLPEEHVSKVKSLGLNPGKSSFIRGRDFVVDGNALVFGNTVLVEDKTTVFGTKPLTAKVINALPNEDRLYALPATRLSDVSLRLPYKAYDGNEVNKRTSNPADIEVFTFPSKEFLDSNVASAAVANITSLISAIPNTITSVILAGTITSDDLVVSKLGYEDSTGARQILETLTGSGVFSLDLSSVYESIDPFVLKVFCTNNGDSTKLVNISGLTLTVEQEKSDTVPIADRAIALSSSIDELLSDIGTTIGTYSNVVSAELEFSLQRAASTSVELYYLDNLSVEHVIETISGALVPGPVNVDLTSYLATTPFIVRVRATGTTPDNVAITAATLTVDQRSVNDIDFSDDTETMTGSAIDHDLGTIPAVATYPGATVKFTGSVACSSSSAQVSVIAHVGSTDSTVATLTNPTAIDVDLTALAAQAVANTQPFSLTLQLSDVSSETIALSDMKISFIQDASTPNSISNVQVQIPLYEDVSYIDVAALVSVIQNPVALRIGGAVTKASTSSVQLVYQGASSQVVLWDSASGNPLDVDASALLAIASPEIRIIASGTASDSISFADVEVVIDSEPVSTPSVPLFTALGVPSGITKVKVRSIQGVASGLPIAITAQTLDEFVFVSQYTSRMMTEDFLIQCVTPGSGDPDTTGTFNIYRANGTLLPWVNVDQSDHSKCSVANSNFGTEGITFSANYQNILLTPGYSQPGAYKLVFNDSQSYSVIFTPKNGTPIQLAETGYLNQTYEDLRFGAKWTMFTPLTFSFAAGDFLTFDILDTPRKARSDPYTDVPGLILQIESLTGVAAGNTAFLSTYKIDTEAIPPGTQYFVDYSIVKQTFYKFFLFDRSAIANKDHVKYIGDESFVNRASVGVRAAYEAGAEHVACIQVPRSDSGWASEQEYSQARAVQEAGFEDNAIPYFIVPMTTDDLTLNAYKQLVKILSAPKFGRECILVRSFSPNMKYTAVATECQAIFEQRVVAHFMPDPVIDLVDEYGNTFEVIYDPSLIAAVYAGLRSSPLYDAATSLVGMGKTIPYIKRMQTILDDTKAAYLSVRGCTVYAKDGTQIVVWNENTTNTTSDLLVFPPIIYEADECVKACRQACRPQIGLKKILGPQAIADTVSQVLQTKKNQLIIKDYKNVTAQEDPTDNRVRTCKASILPMWSTLWIELDFEVVG